MKSNRIIWGLVSLVVLVTIAVSLGTVSSYSQKDTTKEQDKSPFGDLSKYSIADYDAVEPKNASEREERTLKSKRYDKYLLVLKNPAPGDIASFAYDAEPLPSAIPSAESSLIIIGEVINSKASLSNDKSGVYSEYSVQVENVLKEDKQKKLRVGEIITADRAGGLVRYSSGQTMLYLNSWQDLPEIKGRYVFFLSNDAQNPNYKIQTGYRLKNNKVTALDRHPRFREFDGIIETDFISLISSRK